MALQTRPNRFSRLIISLPRLIAEPFGAALVEIGAGAVEERPAEDAEQVELYLVFPERDAIATWEPLVQSMWRAFAEQLELSDANFSVRGEEIELDYHGEWLKHLTVQRLTEQIVLVPTTVNVEGVEGTRQIFFEPHPSFGDGSHPTTRLAARAAERYCVEHRGCSVLDVGTGNGVLALVSASSGAGTVLGIDIDEDAVAIAIENARRNQLDRTCSFSAAGLESIAEQFDLVLANLEPRIQIELLAELAARVAPSGALVLTGFLVDQASTITGPLTDLGFQPVGAEDEGGYALEHWQSLKTRLSPQAAVP